MKLRVPLYCLLTALCSLMIGCRSTVMHMYDDKPPPPIDQLSLILIPAGIDIHSIDENRNDLAHLKRSLFMSANKHGIGVRKLYLKPGKHAFRFSLSRAMWLQTTSDMGYSHELTFETWPGKMYRIMYTVIATRDREKFSIQAWAEKKTAKQTWETVEGATDIAPLSIKRENWSANEAERIYKDWGASSWPDKGLVVFSSVMRRKCPPFPIEFTFSRIGEVNKAFIDDANFQRWKPDLQAFPCVTLYNSLAQSDLLTGRKPHSLQPGDTIPDDQTMGELHVIALPGGQYSAHGFFHDLSTKVRSATTVFSNNEHYAKPHCVPFEVKPGMITYLGSFTALVGKTRLETLPDRGETIVTDTPIVVEDQRQRDLQLFKRLYPKTGISSAMINLLE